MEPALPIHRQLRREAQAQQLVERVQAKIAEAKAANPDFAGKVLVEDYGPENVATTSSGRATRAGRCSTRWASRPRTRSAT